jgi:hypothetical protein
MLNVKNYPSKKEGNMKELVEKMDKFILKLMSQQIRERSTHMREVDFAPGLFSFSCLFIGVSK